MRTIVTAVAVAVLALAFLVADGDAFPPRPDPDPSATPGEIAWWKDDRVTIVPGVYPDGRVAPLVWFECRETWWDKRRCVDIGPPDVWVYVELRR